MGICRTSNYIIGNMGFCGTRISAVNLGGPYCHCHFAPQRRLLLPDYLVGRQHTDRNDLLTLVQGLLRVLVSSDPTLVYKELREAGIYNEVSSLQCHRTHLWLHYSSLQRNITSQSAFVIQAYIS